MIQIESLPFAGLRRNLNFMLEKVIRDMLENEDESAVVTAKIKIGMTKHAVPFTETETRMAFVPEFKYKVTSMKQSKKEIEDEIYEDQMELLIGEDGEVEYRRIETGQMSLADYGYDE